MLRYLRQNTIAFIALILSVFTLGGATAYAVNTIRSSDIVDGQVMNRTSRPTASATARSSTGRSPTLTSQTTA